jgi:hypothetical protein
MKLKHHHVDPHYPTTIKLKNKLRNDEICSCYFILSD